MSLEVGFDVGLDLLGSSSHLLTVGELQGRFIYATEDEFHVKAANLGGLEVPSPILIEAQTGDTSLISQSIAPSDDEPPFLPVQEYWLKKTWRILHNDGVMKALEFLSEEEDEIGEDRGGHGYITNCATVMTSCLKKVQQLSSFIYPDHPVDLDTVCSQYANVSLWSSSTIKGISMHSFLPLVAIAKKDDVIVIKNIQTLVRTIPFGRFQFIFSQQFLKPLKDKYQRYITSIEWSPLSRNMLAVGVVGGVVLWHVEPNTRSTSIFLKCFPEQPVTSISWCPMGMFLACGSPNDSTLIVWDIGFRKPTPLKRYGGGGISHINWSPFGGGRILSSHHTLFRAWETIHWTCEKWTQLAGRCNASCWSPKGDLLVFAVKGDTSLYYVKFGSCDSPSNSSVNEAAVKCADIAEACLAATHDDELRVGGTVQSLAWDKTGKRLAVLFTATSPGASRIAVFRTQCYPVLTLIPGGFIQWVEGTLPVWIGFTSNHRNKTILASAWTDGHIIFTPLCTEPSEDVTTLSTIPYGLFSHK